MSSMFKALGSLLTTIKPKPETKDTTKWSQHGLHKARSEAVISKSFLFLIPSALLVLLNFMSTPIQIPGRAAAPRQAYHGSFGTCAN